MPTQFTRRSFLASAAVAAALAACGGTTPKVSARKPQTTPIGFAAPGTDADLDVVADLWRVMAAGASANVAFSPYSIRRAMAMAWAGARGTTAAEIARALRFGTENSGAVHDAFAATRRELEGRAADGLTLTVADSMWVQRGFAVLGPYGDVITKSYGAEVRDADFVTASAAAVDAINRWVAGKTNDRITRLFSELDRDTRLVLADAVYFLADWAAPFNASDTAKRPFHRFGGETVDVATMSQHTRVAITRANAVTAVELLYKGNHLGMLLLLPDGKEAADLDAALTGASLRALSGGAATKTVQIALPKFTFSAHASLIPALQALGIRQAFLDGADFRGMADTNLAIGAVEHEVFVKVDEKGTEAAAATGVAMRATSIAVADETVTFDRPFAFVLRDKPTGAVLVAGRVVNPS